MRNDVLSTFLGGRVECRFDGDDKFVWRIVDIDDANPVELSGSGESDSDKLADLECFFVDLASVFVEQCVRRHQRMVVPFADV